MCIALNSAKPFFTPDFLTNSWTCGVMLMYSRRLGVLNQISSRKCFMEGFLIAIEKVAFHLRLNENRNAVALAKPQAADSRAISLPKPVQSPKHRPANVGQAHVRQRNRLPAAEKRAD